MLLHLNLWFTDKNIAIQIPFCKLHSSSVCKEDNWVCRKEIYSAMDSEEENCTQAGKMQMLKGNICILFFIFHIIYIILYSPINLRTLISIHLSLMKQ